MKITEIEVSNFKSIEKQIIALSQLNVIVGANAAGKSNMIGILKFISNIIEYGIDNAISLSGGIEYLLNTSIGKKNPMFLKFYIDFENEGWIRIVDKKSEKYLMLLGIKYKFELTANKRGGGYKITQDVMEIIFRQSTDNPEDDKTIELIKDKLLKVEYSRGNGKKVVSSQKNSTDYTNKELEDYSESMDFIKYYLSDNENKKELLLHFIQLFLPPMAYSYNIFSFFDFDPKAMKKPSSLTSISNLAEDGSNIANILNKLLKKKGTRDKLTNLLKDTLPFIESISTENNFDKSITYKIKEKYSAKPLYSHFLSDGTASVLAIIIALYFNEKTGIIVLEEPERNIHPKLMSKIIEMAEGISDDRQIIITTHTPELVKNTNVDNIIFVSRTDKGYSKISRPSDDDMVMTLLANEIGLDTLFTQDLLGE